MLFDIRTLIVIGGVLFAAMALMFWLSARRLPPDERASLRIWTGSLILQPPAWALLAARGAIADEYSIVLANALLMLGLCESARATRRYLGLPERRGWLWAMPIAIGGVLWWYSRVDPDYSVRVIAVSCGYVIALAAMATALFVGVREEAPVPRRPEFWLCVLGIAFIGWRISEHLLHPRPDGTLFQGSAFDALGVGYAAIAPIFMSVGFLLLHHERAYREMHALATVDTLTGALTRRAAESRGEQLLRESRATGRPLSLLMIDVDHFKQINDRHGHAAGDEVLRLISRRIRSQLRACDLVGRIGGEEFMVLLPGAGDEQAQAIADRIHHGVRAQPVEYRDLALEVTVSVGVARTLSDDDFWALLTRGDHAMYDAKRTGRDRVVLSAESAPAAS